ncbi:GATOR complex protein NPRL3 [Diachasma alloeum]|uniref:GATOR complex protein NPRL3 n=1 Tax=Diachasma alloeum TaxID=454923 RepID=UPI0007383542|nr:GATOR complex protein NPRL3 [Diachasma alloeum]XP_015112542.1 GATOR complex protein NPRL3 [Diachasma alloeum]XP_015112544.1 GATOR complex protein NPRL3 [Diachasma alloeum]XP_015112545.1 GATOR complex protein NPRL3 [Diachasma alloeum]XP_015112546.1 GATOR complex protein NPRL3 [Diachasma alloeum]XP_015112547.1 GATOR complex protein NPRL3 [Diachasma alloeum]XP_015112548.1 GATOR complex protein NPRL3 [Diachasma alloeum]XP_015112549.1 GATOR complex protein NPRL3 [Diachasma alloeum]
MEINPLSIILVKSDSKGDRMLFRYPHATNHERDSSHFTKRKNPYSLIIAEDLLQSLPCPTSNITNGNLTGLPDEVLSTLFAVKPELCEMKFELKVNNVRFVGHPTLLSSRGLKETNSSMLFNVVFALQAQADHSVVKCYYDLSKRLGIALRHEEKRCGFLSSEIKVMVLTHDEIATRSEEESDCEENPYELILKKSSLARDLKSAFNSLCTSGFVDLMINKWIQVSFCLPQKVHQSHKKGFIMNPETIDRCLDSLRPYHGILLLIEPLDLLESLPADASPALRRLIQMYNPLKSLQTLAADSDLSLAQVFQLTGHLVYWAKATIIYPLCESNVYVVCPDALISNQLMEAFADQFPGLSLLQVISEFSLPTSISQKLNPLNQPQQQQQLVKIIIWLLRHHLLLQLHTYVQYMPTDHGRNTLETLSQEGSSPTGVTENDSSWSLSNTPKSTPNEMRTERSMTLPKEDGIFEYRSENFPIPSDDIMLLDRLCRFGYFDGGHHLEEIMYFENIRRSQLLQILDKFRDILITSEHEDPAIALFYSQHGSP